MSETAATARRTRGGTAEREDAGMQRFPAPGAYLVVKVYTPSQSSPGGALRNSAMRSR